MVPKEEVDAYIGSTALVMAVCYLTLTMVLACFVTQDQEVLDAGSFLIAMAILNLLTPISIAIAFCVLYRRKNPRTEVIHDLVSVNRRIQKLCRNQPDLGVLDLSSDIVKRSLRLERHIFEMRKVLAHGGDRRESISAVIDKHIETLRRNRDILLDLHLALAEAFHLGNGIAIEDARRMAESTLSAMREVAQASQEG